MSTYRPTGSMTVATLILTVVALTIGCHTITSSGSDFKRVQEFADLIGETYVENPALPGFQDYNAISAAAFADRTDEEAAILLGAIFVSANDQLTRAQKYPAVDTREQVRRLLGQRRPTDRHNRQYFDNLLAETRSRLASDPNHRCAVGEAQFAARYIWSTKFDDFQCRINGLSRPISECRAAVLADAVDSLTFD